jgi:hypothetical protein
MELDGLKKGLQFLSGRMTVSHLVTDRHVSIKKYMSDRNKTADDLQKITHHFDIWHVAKGRVISKNNY